MTSAFRGLMKSNRHIGDGEGGDLKSVGTGAYLYLSGLYRNGSSFVGSFNADSISPAVTFSCLIFLLAYKVSLVVFVSLSRSLSVGGRR